jgi:hypothetical protein
METLGRKAIGPLIWQPVAEKVFLYFLHGFLAMLFYFYIYIYFSKNKKVKIYSFYTC